MANSARDNRFSVAVLKKYRGMCPHCCKRPTGGVHHIFGRDYINTRFLLENGIPTCFEWHRMWEDPDKAKNLIDIWISRPVYEELWAISRGYKENTHFTVIE